MTARNALSERSPFFSLFLKLQFYHLQIPNGILVSIAKLFGFFSFSSQWWRSFGVLFSLYFDVKQHITCPLVGLNLSSRVYKVCIHALVILAILLAVRFIHGCPSFGSESFSKPLRQQH